MNIYTALCIIIVTSCIDFFAGKHFADASSNLGDYFRLPRSVKGATFDAIASSFPELMVAVFSVIAFKRFDVGVGTIVGSALFNLLVIIGFSVLLCPSVFKISKEVLDRDGLFYLFSVILLGAALLFMKTWGIIIAILFIGVYAVYILIIARDTVGARVKKPTKEISLSKEITKAIVMMGVIAAATYYLTEASIELATILNIPAVVIAFTVVAVATSLPDAIISFVNARKGSIDDASSNALGSNIFDILIGLGFPILLMYFISGPVTIIFDHMGILYGLLISTTILLLFLRRNYMLSKKKAIVLIMLYVVFVGYVIML